MLKSLLVLFFDESVCVNLLRSARWSNGICCPVCYSSKVRKHCKYREIFQRYWCHDCNHTFNDKTGTMFHYSHASLSSWFLAVYLFCMISWNGISIRALSLQLEISYRICYHMIRALMERIAVCNNPKLDGTIEHDELYVKAGMKGSGYHYDIIKERMPRKRGLKPPPGRGTFENDQPMILCYHQRNGITALNVSAGDNLLSSLVCNTVGYGSTVYTDEYPAYQRLKEYGFEHETVCHSTKEYARGDVHTNNCECRTNLFKLWLGKFMGVNKYNMHLYAKTFQFLHNNRKLDDHTKFMKILSVIYLATRFGIMSEEI